MLRHVSPGLNFWYCLAIISSSSWLLSSLAMDFIKKTTRPVFLISTLVLLWFTSNPVLTKFYFSLERNPDTDRFFHGYESAGKTIGFVLLLFGNVGLYYFSEKSFACILTFLFLSFYCLCCCLCIQPYTDFGILDFLLGATLNQTLSLFGLRSSSTWLVVVALVVIAGLRYFLQPSHPPGEATSAEADQLESGQLLPTACKEEPPPLGAQLANKDPSQFGCILELDLSGSTNPLLERERERITMETANDRFQTLPYRRRLNDLQAADSREYEDDSSSGPFDIYRTENASVDRLRRWRVVRWGRSVYANIQNFIQFQLTVNVAALVINVVAAVSSGDVPLNAVQLLWVNLIMDTLGALALATEPPTDELMHRPPVGRREPLITNIMWRNLLMQAFYQVTVLLILNFKGRKILHLEHYDDHGATKVKNTLIFNAFVFCQIFNGFNARKPEEINIFKGVTKNYLFMGIVGLTILLQVIIVMFLGKFAGTVRLSWKLWLVSIAIGIVSWPLAIVGKLIPVPETPLHEFFTRIWSRIWPGQRTL